MFPVRLSAELCRKLAAALEKERVCRLGPLPFSALAYLALEMRSALGRAVVVVTESMKALDDMHRCLTTLAGNADHAILYYPPLELGPRGGRAPDPEAGGHRLRTLLAVRDLGQQAVVATCVQALMQKTAAPEALAASVVTLALAEAIDPQNVLDRLERTGYEFVAEVQFRGQAAWRGGLLDVWPPSEPYPLRIEFFGSQVETIRSFDPADQRSFERLERITLVPADERRVKERSGTGACLEHLPREIIYFWAESGSGASLAPPGSAAGGTRSDSGIDGHAAAYAETLAAEGAADLIIPYPDLQEKIAANPAAWQCFTEFDLAGTLDTGQLDLGFRPMTALTPPRRELLAPDVFEEQRRQWLARLEERAGGGLQIFMFFGTEGALDRFRETHPGSPFQLQVGALCDSFVHEGLRLAVIAESHIVGLRKIAPGRYAPRAGRRSAPRAAQGETIADWMSIEPGDLVVHADQGIGRYLGLYEIEFNGKLQEALTIEFAEKAKLYVPVSQTHLLSRYVGAGKHHPRVHRLGGRRWLREKATVEQAVRDLAAGLLEVQAMRETLAGFAFPPDTPWQHEFEAAFPYEETADQQRAIAELKRDLESARPLDRLICGDVGYGKTEVAMRAAFKAVMAGKQVAVLVPTTVLAQQHYDVFLDRMGAYPVRVELLCRFRTPFEQQAVVRDLAAGTVDIVIGTHRLLQADVRFKDLGLVIIDEEQRFGVEHKERFKHIKQLVDVLTLTATPIPRTLYLSLTGAREISMIQTPPRERQPIETVVTPNDDHIVREAIRRELNRGGQVYYVHNRVMTIEKVRERLARLVPAARIALGHGQMPTVELALVMRQFARGAYDILLCTTIIESGIDMPNVNTILIDRADRFGMADLYQLRGRVGRSSRKAYAFMLLPVQGRLLDTSRKRLQAVMEHADLGAGFRLAMRDLEIRGAGNLLGAEQSGHIAAIGFDLYCQLLRRTVAQLKAGPGAPTPPAFRVVDVEVRLDFIDLSVGADPDHAAILPAAYVEDERLRIGVYRQIAAAVSTDEIQALRAEFRDRFGLLPPPLERLLQIARMRIVAREKGVNSIETADGKIMLQRGGDYLLIGRRFPRLQAADPDARLAELMARLERMA